MRFRTDKVRKDLMNSMAGNRRLVTLLILAGLLLGTVLAGMLVFNGSVVSAQSGDDDAAEVEDNGAEDTAEGADMAITGSALDRAGAAALDYIGEGRVTGTEVGDEEGYYEVEITLDNGRQVDVHLDEGFKVIGREG
jgi:hypothetical protein